MGCYAILFVELHTSAIMRQPMPARAKSCARQQPPSGRLFHAREERAMTETTLKVRLDELTTVRIVCGRQNCGGVIEVPTSKLVGMQWDVKCPVCSKPFLGESPPESVLADLGKVLDRFSQHAFKVEFPLRVEANKVE